MKTLTVIKFASITCLTLLLAPTSHTAENATPKANPSEAVTSTDADLKLFESLNAWEFGVVQRTVISTNGTSPVFSPRCDKLAFVEPRQLQRSIIIKSLPDLASEKVFKLAGDCLAWSPDGKRLVCAVRVGKTFILEVESGKQMELPEVSFSATPVFWVKEDEICSAFYEQTYTLNLDTLKYGYDPSAARKVFDGLRFSTHPKLYLVNNDHALDEVFVTSKARDYTKFLVLNERADESFQRGGEYSWSSNSKYVAKVKESRFGEQRLCLFTLGKIESSGAEMALRDFRGMDDPVRKFQSLRSDNITANVYAPKRNPLNDKVVGSAGDRKASGDIKIRDGQLIFCTTTEFTQPNAGDVVQFVGAGGPVQSGAWAVLGKPIDGFGETNDKSGSKAEQANAGTGSKLQPVQSSNYVDKVYGNGAGSFKFGMTPEQVAPIVGAVSSTKWQELPVADEYKGADVRYFFKYLNEAENVPRLWGGKFSQSSYICFLFYQAKLFRISLRFMNDSSCPSHDQVFDHVATISYAETESLGDGQRFNIQSSKVLFHGFSDSQGVIIDIIQNGSPKSDRKSDQ